MIENKVNGKIYTLTDPITKEIRYIGKTIVKLKTRLSQHISEARKHTRTRKCAWVRSLLNKGLKPIINIVYETNSEIDLLNKEIELIAKCNNLTNSTPGGDNPPKNGYLKRKKVYRSDGQVFESVKLAAETIGIDHSAIFQAMRNDRTCQGYKWSYKQFNTILDRTTPRNSIVFRSDGKKFNNAKKAALECNIKYKALIACLNGRCKTCAGFMWSYIPF